MDISWLGGSCFRLHANGLQVLTDPFDLPTPIVPLADEIVTLSQRAAGGRLALGQVYRLIDGPGEYEIKGMPITGVATSGGGGSAPVAADRAPTDRALTGGAPTGGPPSRDRNVAYTVVMDGVAVCHLGRIDRPLSAPQLQEIGSPDVLLLPLHEGSGLTLAQAVQLTSQLEARLLAPVPLVSGADDAVVERFCRELGADPANFSPRLTVSTSGLPAQVQVVRLSVADSPAGPTRPPAVPERSSDSS
ncbi:MAG: MBL fold metallo-hydrolase [Chloroflexota bacterium]|nr:MBL fold metallo-hydrolase [Chloroflexota bacterium]